MGGTPGRHGGAQIKENEMSDNGYGIFRGPGPREQAQHERDMDRIAERVAEERGVSVESVRNGTDRDEK